MNVEVERCGACGFDAGDYTRASATSTLKVLGPWWRYVVEGVEDEVLRRRPDRATWSAVEYIAHTADVAAAMGYLLHLLAAEGGFDLDSPADAVPGADGAVPAPASHDADATVASVIETVDANAVRAARKATQLDDPAWAAIGRVDGDAVDADWVLRHAVHDITHHIRDVGANLHALGVGPAQQSGRLEGIFTSGGGVPKLPVDSAEITRRGVAGDAHDDAKHHGRPFQALCLWSAEVIDELRSEGHPIEAGAAGENLSLSGLDWASLRPGTRLQIGADVVAEISSPATPCAKNAHWFAGGDFRRMDHDLHPGASRLYAWVVTPGSVRAGDSVSV